METCRKQIEETLVDFFLYNSLHHGTKFSTYGRLHCRIRH